jgi:ketosteroid isomerase-like protein
MHLILAAYGCVVATAAQNVITAQASSQAADRAELSRLEDVWNQAHLRGDAESLDRIWSDDLEVAVPQMPVLRKAELLAFVRSGRMKFLRYETSDLHIRTYGTSAVVTGRLERKRSIGGHEVDDDWRFTKVYVRGSGGWRVVSFHASEAAKPPL